MSVLCPEYPKLLMTLSKIFSTLTADSARNLNEVVFMSKFNRIVVNLIRSKVEDMLSMLLLVAFLSCGASANDIWTTFPGSMTHISAKGDYLWAVDGQCVYSWNESKWTLPPNWIGCDKHNVHTVRKIQIAACADGYIILIYGHEHRDLHRISGDNKWLHIGIKGVDVVSAYSRDSAIAVKGDGTVHQWSSGQWAQIGQDARWAAIGEAGERWMIGSNGSIYRWEGEKWQVKSGPKAVTIDVENADRVVITDEDYKIYTWQNPNWEQVEGFAKQATISKTMIYTLPPSEVQATKFKTCEDSFIFKNDTTFYSCSVSLKTINDITPEKCCKKCKKVAPGGGCYAHDNECTICNGVVRDEQSLEGSQVFLRADASAGAAKETK